MTDTPRSEARDPRLAIVGDWLETGHETGRLEYADLLARLDADRAARQPAADTSGLRAALRDAADHAHRAQREVHDLSGLPTDATHGHPGPFATCPAPVCSGRRDVLIASLSGATPEATAPGLDATLHEPPGIDVAWSEAEAALPHGGYTITLTSNPSGRWTATAFSRLHGRVHHKVTQDRYPSAETALRALARRLTEQQGSGS